MVKVAQMKKIGKQMRTYDDADADEVGVVSEKALKGQAISHSVK